MCAHTAMCVPNKLGIFCTCKPSKDFNNLMGALYIAAATDWIDSALSLIAHHLIAKRKTTHVRPSKIKNSVPKQTLISKPHLSRKIFLQLVQKLMFIS